MKTNPTTETAIRHAFLAKQPAQRCGTTGVPRAIRFTSGALILPLLACSLGGCGTDEDVSTRTDPGPQTVSGSEFIASVPATSRAGIVPNIASWDIYRADDASLAVTGTTNDGNVAYRFGIARTADQITRISIGSETLDLGKDGQVIANTLSAPSNEVFASLSADMAEVKVEYGVLGCGAAILSIIAVSAGCGASVGVGCLGIPLAFCAGSKYCGNNVC